MAQFTDIDEAEKYILESISVWKDSDKQKINSLAGMAEKWRRKRTITPAMKKKELEKNIKGLKLIIKRSKKLDENANTIPLEAVLDMTVTDYDALGAILGGAIVKPIGKK